MHATPDTRLGSGSGELAEALHRLLPFHYFYEKAGESLPDFHFLEGRDIPYPYRSLLVHDNDMTPTLAAFHHSKLYLEVHERESCDSYLMRLVTLHAAASDAPVEYGAIGIQLEALPEEVRPLVVEGKTPLGGILGEHGVDHHGSPTSYFKVPADQRIAGSLKAEPGEFLYGRCNQLLDTDGMVIADIVEILPRNGESERWVGNVNGQE